MATIHPTAVIDRSANIASDVTIGPFCVVEADVSIGDGCTLASHAVVKTRTKLGKNNIVHEGAVLGGRPQHLGAGDIVGRLIIGDDNVIRENATIHCGLKEDDLTTIGNGNLIMVNVHIGHDSWIGNQTILTNNVMIAGHVTIEDRVYISGAAGIHQFCRVGQLAMVGGQSHVSQDIPPFVMVDGISNFVVGLNRVGIRRAGFTSDDMAQLKAAYRIIYRSGLSHDELLLTLEQEFRHGPAAEYFEFFRNSTRGYVRERRTPPGSTIRLFKGDDPESSAGKSVRHAS